MQSIKRSRSGFLTQALRAVSAIAPPTKRVPTHFPAKIVRAPVKEGILYNCYFVLSLTAVSVRDAMYRRSKQVWRELPGNFIAESFANRRSQTVTEKITRIVSRVFSKYNLLKAKTLFDGGVKLAALQREYGWFRHGIKSKVATKSKDELYVWDRLMQLSTTTYGWKTLVFLGLGDIFSLNASIIGGIRHLTGIPEEDVLVAQETSHLYRPGHVVVIDRDLKQVVVAVRGTVRFQDMITNLTCEEVPFRIQVEDGSHIYGKTHEGFLLSAQNLHEELHEIVKKAMEDHPDFSLSICGHSMGGACASLLALMWGGEFKGRTVHGFSFAAPCVLSESVSQADYVKSHVTSVVLGDDMVSRLSLGTFEDLVAACLHLGAHGKATLPSDGKEKVIKKIRKQKELETGKLFPCGNVYHIPYLSRYNSKSHDVITAEVIDPSISLREILFTPKMFSAHLPSNYLNSIRMQIFLHETTKRRENDGQNVNN